MKKFFILIAAALGCMSAFAQHVQVTIDLNDDQWNKAGCTLNQEQFTFNVLSGMGAQPEYNSCGWLTVKRGNTMSLVVDNLDDNYLVQVILTVDTASGNSQQYIWKSGDEFATTNAVLVNMMDMTIRKITAVYTGMPETEKETNIIDKTVLENAVYDIHPKGIYTMSGIKLDIDKCDLAPGIYVIDGVKTYVK